MHTLRRRVVSALLLAAAITLSAAANAEIKLVLQITVDGFRGDLPERYRESFGEGGLAYLLDEGVWFSNAHYQHANTETIVGHATLATGTTPRFHGMTGNVWLDAGSGEIVYNIEDPDFPLLPSREEGATGVQVDPSQLAAGSDGRSPRTLLAETLSDRMHAYYGQRSRSFGVSGKDRGAVSMAGRAGKAFWMSTDTGDFITSRYYYERYPPWVQRWNAQRKVSKLAGTRWSLLADADSYLLAHQDDRPYEVDLRGYGRTFPHPFPGADSPLLPTLALVSPYGDELTLDFAKALMVAENPGSGDVPDYLSISFSGVDAVNHFFGPSSLENEDTVRRLDRTLADLFETVERSIGLEHTLIVLSADHGMPEMPEYMSNAGLPAGRLYDEEVETRARKAARELFGIEDAVREFFRPYLYLDHQAIEAAGHSPEEVRRGVSTALTRSAGIARAEPRDTLDGVGDRLHEQLRQNFHPERSGDIYVVPDPYWFNYQRGPIAAIHGSPWRYDTHVPVIFAGAGLAPRRVARLVHPADVAPTLAAALGMSGPGSATGSVLPEVVEQLDR